MKGHVPLADLIVSAVPGFASGERSEDGVLQVRMNCVSTEGLLDLAGALRVPAPGNVDRLFLEPGDVLFNATNSPHLVGKTALFSGWPEPVTFSNHFLRLRCDPRRLDPAYLSRWLHGQWRGRVFGGMCTQWVNQASVRKDRLFALKIPLPSLPEQRRIAAILDKADAIRRKRKESLALLDELLRSTFLEMFGDPVRNERGWEVVKLGEVIASTQYGVGSKANTDGRGLPVLRMNNITVRGGWDLTSIKWCDVAPADRETFTVKRGDLLFNRTNSPELVGKAAVWRGPEGCAYAGYLVRVRVDPRRMVPEFVSGYLNSVQGKKLLFAWAKASNNMSNISASELRRLPVPVPALRLQAEFDKAVVRILETRSRAEAATQLASSLLESLSQRAFQGRL